MGSSPLVSTSPEGRAVKNRGSKCRLASASHDGVFGYDSLASTKKAGMVFDHSCFFAIADTAKNPTNSKNLLRFRQICSQFKYSFAESKDSEPILFSKHNFFRRSLCLFQVADLGRLVQPNKTVFDLPSG